MGVAITVKNVSKTFKLPHEKQNSVKGLFVSLFNGKRTYERQQVLQDISFEIKEGEFFGIVGRNGSGKSTLLKLLAGIYEPNKGAVHVNGKLTPFIELGVGFNPNLTGRENVYLNGALLGFTRKEMNAMYEDIVEFAELDKFMDQKLKNYSSGMQVRLAFSIAIRVKSDVILIDEVLAVGDAAFQQKCFDYFSRLKREKQTIVFVSHDMAAVRKFCTRALLISEGKIIDIGEPSKIAHQYTQLNKLAMNGTPETDQETSKIEVEIRDSKGHETDKFHMHEEIKVTLKWDKEMQPKHAGVAIMKQTGEYMFGSNTVDKEVDISSGKVEYDVELSLEPGTYHLVVGLFGESDNDADQYLYKTPDITILPAKGETDYGLARLSNQWHTAKSKARQ